MSSPRTHNLHTDKIFRTKTQVYAFVSFLMSFYLDENHKYNNICIIRSRAAKIASIGHTICAVYVSRPAGRRVSITTRYAY